MHNKLNIIKSNYTHWTEISTRWRDMDAIGHINHVVYLTYMESSRVDLLKKIGFPGLIREMDESAILGGLEIHYLMQASHPEILDVGSRISRIGEKSYDINSVVYKKKSEDLLCAATFRMIAFNYKKNKTIKVPKIIVEAYDNNK